MTTRKPVLLLIAAAAALGAQLSATEAFATTALKQVQVSNGSQIDLLFDGKVSRNQIKTEFFNDIIQISLTDVSVYPAKISSVNGGSLTKIFAYQYAPKLVRCRLSVKGKAEDYRNRLVLDSGSGGPNGKILTIRFRGAESKPVESAKNVDTDEQKLLEHVMKGSAAKPSVAQEGTVSDRIIERAAAEKAAAEKTAAPTTVAVVQPESSESKPLNFSREGHSDHLGGAKNRIPNPMGVFGKLALVVGLFSLLALGFKKFWKSKAESQNAFLGAITQFARSSLGVKANASKLAIEMLSHHHLGPKKSIAVVRVAGRTMLVGITDQAINLISHLGSEEEAMNALVEMENPPLEDNGPFLNATAKLSAPFSNLLKNEAAKPAMNAGAPAPKPQARPEVKPEVKPEIKKDVRVTGYGTQMAGGVTGNVRVSTPEFQNFSAQAAMGLSGVRAQIKSKLEGLKQI